MLRRLEKGLNNAKLKSQSADLFSPDSRNGSLDPSYRSADIPYGSPNTHFPTNELPPLNLPSFHGDAYPQSNRPDAHPMDMDDDDDDPDPFPAKMISKEKNQRNSFFRTILNPEEAPPGIGPNRGNSFSPPQPRSAPAASGYNDAIAAGIVDEEQAKVLFDLIFLRLNPFINLFDPALHSVHYVRSKCPFLFTTLIMAGCKFFKPELFKQCQKLANEFAVRAFAEAWKSVEVVQAFACLTYWKDPDDNVRRL